MKNREIKKGDYPFSLVTFFLLHWSKDPLLCENLKKITRETDNGWEQNIKSIEPHLIYIYKHYTLNKELRNRERINKKNSGNYVICISHSSYSKEFIILVVKSHPYTKSRRGFGLIG